MYALQLENVVKRYGSYAAVDDVSFSIKQGSLFGLLGPNGAGKTSLIRIITRITGADEGEIKINGKKLNEVEPRLIGYLPEERGLYKKMKVGEQLLYLAQIKGLEKKEATEKLKSWMKKFDIEDWWNKKIQELSKGMQQKVQFIATVVHDPDLIILDEPFSGLDPINTNLIKDEIYRLKEKGKSVIFSTHRMEQVEEICEDIVLINKGRIILEGNVSEIKNKFKENKFRFQLQSDWPSDIAKSTFEMVSNGGKEVIIKVHDGHNSNELLKQLLRREAVIQSYNEVFPSLNEIFIKQVGESNE
jgi:ABC-2 type transport system ATP-binding protein